MAAGKVKVTMNNILITGGSGLLGSELKKLMPEARFPSSSEFNVTDPAQMLEYVRPLQITTLVHAAAFTSPPKVQADPTEALNVNIVGTANVVNLCRAKSWRLVYISTDYVFRGDKGNYAETDPVYPVNRYAWSKLGGECAVRLYENSLIVRTSFGEKQFPYEKAFVDQWTSRETVDVFAQKLVDLISRDDLFGTIHVGSRRRTVFEYALECAGGKDIGRRSIQGLDFSVPEDTSLDCTKFESLQSDQAT